MSDVSPSSAVRYAGRRTRELLFSPFDLKFFLYACTASPFGKKDDPRLLELKRLKPYYRGTRLLSAFAIALVLLSLLLPFSVIFVGMDGFFALLVAYIVLLVVVSIIGLFFEMILDAVFAISHDMNVPLPEAFRAFMRFTRANHGYAVRYMLIKLAADMFLVMLITTLFLPALLGAIAMLESLIRSVSAGATNVGALMTPWLIGITFLLLLAMFLSGLLSVPISAFYGYYTEDAARSMCRAETEHGGE